MYIDLSADKNYEFIMTCPLASLAHNFLEQYEPSFPATRVVDIREALSMHDAAVTKFAGRMQKLNLAWYRSRARLFSFYGRYVEAAKTMNEGAAIWEDRDFFPWEQMRYRLAELAGFGMDEFQVDKDRLLDTLNEARAAIRSRKAYLTSPLTCLAAALESGNRTVMEQFFRNTPESLSNKDLSQYWSWLESRKNIQELLMVLDNAQIHAELTTTPSF